MSIKDEAAKSWEAYQRNHNRSDGWARFCFTVEFVMIYMALIAGAVLSVIAGLFVFLWLVGVTNYLDL